MQDLEQALLVAAFQLDYLNGIATRR